MKVLIKLGGTLLEETGSRDSLAFQLAELARLNDVVVVHGGGKQVTQFLEERGLPSRFVGGLRVSDDLVIDAVVKVIAGSINTQLVTAIVAAGGSAVGLSGVDGRLTMASQLKTDLGSVGKPGVTDSKLFDLLLSADFLPVVACIAGDGAGNIYNVNADQMAVSCAIGWQAEKLVFLTDVPGVKNSSGQVVSSLSSAESAQLIVSGTAHGGMQAKLEAAQSALLGGISEVIVASGREPAVCQRLVSGERFGTRIVGSAAVEA